VEAVYEVGLKLCYVMWRKFSEPETDTADRKFNGRCMELIVDREYHLAEALLSFSSGVQKVGEVSRRMMVVNLANAMRLQGKADEAKRLLDSEDWSATNDQFKLCVASVLGNIDEVLTLMDRLGDREPAENYRTWPVFRKTRRDPAFRRKVSIHLWRASGHAGRIRYHNGRR
jgi:hypothetical protein